MYLRMYRHYARSSPPSTFLTNKINIITNVMLQCHDMRKMMYFSKVIYIFLILILKYSKHVFETILIPYKKES